MVCTCDFKVSTSVVSHLSASSLPFDDWEYHIRYPAYCFFVIRIAKETENALQYWLNTNAMQLASVIILGGNEYTTSFPCNVK